MKKAIVAPSVLAADFRDLTTEIEKINHSRAEWIHFDVMDGVNVPNISFGFPILKAVRSLTNKFIDAHLMIDRPERYFEEFKKNGADGVTIPIENADNITDNIFNAKKHSLKIGLALNPDTPIEEVFPYLESLDLVLIMSVFPGFGGQKFIETTYTKVKNLKSEIDKQKLPTLIEVDGGVSIDNAAQLRSSGADILVSGSALFRAENFDTYVDKLIG